MYYHPPVSLSSYDSTWNYPLGPWYICQYLEGYGQLSIEEVNYGFGKMVLVYYRKSEEEWGVPLASIGIQHEESPGDLKIYPIPATSELFLKNLKPNSSIEIYNPLGELLFTQNCEGTEQSVDVNDFLSGNYSIKIKDPHNSVSKRFVIIK